jgi:hypothetical protein
MSNTSFTADLVENVVRAAVARVRNDYRATLASQGSPEFIAFGMAVCVDRVRKLIVPAEMKHAAIWNEKEASISNQSMIARVNLAAFVGRQRHLWGTTVVGIIGDVARGDGHVLRSETEACLFLDLVVVEPYQTSEIELPIWAALAQLFAADRLFENIFPSMPPLASDYDILHEQIPADARERKDLIPGSSRGHAGSLGTFQVGLLTAIRPDVAGAVQAASTEEERRALFNSQQGFLRDYVRTHLFGRVATALNNNEI